MTDPIPAGDPVDMSQVHMGERYDSEDMYRDFPHLRRGQRVSVERDGVVYTDTVEAVTYRSAESEIRRRPTGWRRVLRSVTPRRWRKPLPIVRPYKPAEVTVQVGADVDPMSRAARAAEDMHNTVTRLLDRGDR